MCHSGIQFTFLKVYFISTVLPVQCMVFVQEKTQHLCRRWLSEFLTWENNSVLQQHLDTRATAFLNQGTNVEQQITIKSLGLLYILFCKIQRGCSSGICNAHTNCSKSQFVFLQTQKDRKSMQEEQRENDAFFWNGCTKLILFEEINFLKNSHARKSAIFLSKCWIVHTWDGSVCLALYLVQSPVMQMFTLYSQVPMHLLRKKFIHILGSEIKSSRL